jgi:hypothetical protein
MKVTLVFAGLILSFMAGSQVSVSWVNYPGGVSLAADASGHIYTAYWDYNPGGDITLTKRDTTGYIVWEESYDNTDNSRHEVATWVETDSDNNVIISGTIRSGYSNPVNANSLLMKFGPSGNILWRIVYETDFDGSSTKKCLVDSADNIYVLGLGNSGSGMVTTVKKFDPDGNSLWAFYDTAGIGAPVNFKFTPDDGILITARSIFGSINGYAKIDLEGNSIWSFPGVYSLTLGDAAGDHFGNSYIVNGEYILSDPGSVVTKLSPSGSVIWEKINDLSGFRVEVGSDESPVISGYPNSNSPGAAFIKYDSNGSVLWQNLDADGPGLNLLAHSHMKLDVTDAVYLAAGTMFEMAVCKVNSDGTSAWTATSMGSYAYVIDLGADGSVYVTGGATAKLSQSGTITSLNDKSIQNISLYPNPVTNGTFYLELGLKPVSPAILKIYSVTGQKVKESELNEANSAIKTEGLTKGIYLLEVEGNGNVRKLKIMINN